MVLDHFGTPLGVGPYASQREQIFEQWKADIAEIATCENVVAKIGGLAMPDNGFGWHTAERPPTSDEFVAAQGGYYLHTIEQFGPERCMFESNFPVDRLSLSYRMVWNAFKKMIADFTADERDAMLRGTAARSTARLPVCGSVRMTGPVARKVGFEHGGRRLVGAIIAAITSAIICERGGMPGELLGLGRVQLFADAVEALDGDLEPVGVREDPEAVGPHRVGDEVGHRARLHALGDRPPHVVRRRSRRPACSFGDVAEFARPVALRLHDPGLHPAGAQAADADRHAGRLHAV